MFSAKHGKLIPKRKNNCQCQNLSILPQQSHLFKYVSKLVLALFISLSPKRLSHSLS